MATGKDGDLVCVLPNVRTKELGELSLSPVCSNRILALICFTCKLILIKLDRNVTIRRYADGNHRTDYSNH